MLAALLTVAAATAWPLATNNANTIPVVLTSQQTTMTGCYDTVFCRSDTMAPVMGTPYCCDKYPDPTMRPSACWRGAFITQFNTWRKMVQLQPLVCDIIVHDTPAWWCCDADYDDDFSDDDFF